MAVATVTTVNISITSRYWDESTIYFHCTQFTSELAKCSTISTIEIEEMLKEISNNKKKSLEFDIPNNIKSTRNCNALLNIKSIGKTISYQQSAKS